MNYLQKYYMDLFPFSLLCRWLSYGNKEGYLSRREFAYMFGDVFARYQTIVDAAHFRRNMWQERPDRIDIGAVYTLRMKDKKHPNFNPCEKELNFDIDITDYSDVRFCCTGVQFCRKCWKYMVVACKILDTALREDFGFDHLLWVFSGRRGIHCWVCDNSVRVFTPDVRAAIIGYLQLVNGGMYMSKRANLDGHLDISAQRAVEIMSDYFEEVCIQDQDILGTPEKIEMFEAMLGEDADFKSEVMKRLDTCSNSSERWSAFTNYVDELHNKEELKPEHSLIVEEVVIQYLYPRLDAAVSNSVNHLLKCPFSVHVSTGRISIPFSPGEVESFDPTMYSAPTASMAVQELEQKECEDSNQPGPAPAYHWLEGFEKGLAVFEKFVQKMEEARGGKASVPSMKPLQKRYEATLAVPAFMFRPGPSLGDGKRNFKKSDGCNTMIE